MLNGEIGEGVQEIGRHRPYGLITIHEGHFVSAWRFSCQSTTWPRESFHLVLSSKLYQNRCKSPSKTRNKIRRVYLIRFLAVDSFVDDCCRPLLINWCVSFVGLVSLAASVSVPIVPCLDFTLKIGVKRLSEPSNNEVIANSWKRTTNEGWNDWVVHARTGRSEVSGARILSLNPTGIAQIWRASKNYFRW